MKRSQADSRRESAPSGDQFVKSTSSNLNSLTATLSAQLLPVFTTVMQLHIKRNCLAAQPAERRSASAAAIPVAHKFEPAPAAAAPRSSSAGILVSEHQ